MSRSGLRQRAATQCRGGNLAGIDKLVRVKAVSLNVAVVLVGNVVLTGPVTVLSGASFVPAMASIVGGMFNTGTVRIPAELRILPR